MFYKGKPSAMGRLIDKLMPRLNSTFLRRNGNTPMSGGLTIDTNDTTALLVEQDGVKDNVLIVDTTNGRVGVGIAPTAGQIHIYHATDNTVALLESGDVNVALDFKDNSATGTIQWNGSKTLFKFQDAVVVETGSDASQINFTNAANEGGYLTSSAAGDAILSGGMEYDGSDWYARDTSAGAYQIFNGAHYWFGNTGETPDATMTPTQTMSLTSAGGLLLPSIKSGATQGAAGAAANGLWKTASHATLPDNVVMIGV